MKCLAPSHHAGDCGVWISPNNGYDWVSVSQSLLYTSMPTSFGDMFPIGGPIGGGTNVSFQNIDLSSNNIQGKPFLFCRFGVLEVAAAISTNDAGGDEVSCLSPMAYRTGEVAVNLVLRYTFGKQRTVIKSDLKFTYFDDVSISNISPKQGSAFGGTVLTIHGSGFVESTALVVSFVIESPSAADEVVTAPGVYIDENTVKVTTPPSTGIIGVQGGFASVKVSNNMVDYTPTSILYYYMDSVVIQSLEPVVLFENGGTSVSISVDGFVPTFPNVLLSVVCLCLELLSNVLLLPVLLV